MVVVKEYFPLGVHYYEAVVLKMLSQDSPNLVVDGVIAIIYD
jgi:hypothetical protein